jgi:hypothetical protein
MQIGPIRHAVEAKSQAAGRPFEHVLIVRDTAFRMDAEAGIQEIYRALANDQARNEGLANDVIAALEEGRSPIL